MIFVIALLALIAVFACIGEVAYERKFPTHTLPYALFAALLLLFGASAFGQGVMYNNNITTAATNVPVGAQAPVYTVPYAGITVCVDKACTVQQPVFTDATLTTPVPQPFTTDAVGGFTVGIAPGTYWYQVSTRGGRLIGTFPFSTSSVGGPAGTPGPPGTVTAGGVSGSFNVPNALTVGGPSAFTANNYVTPSASTALNVACSLSMIAGYQTGRETYCHQVSFISTIAGQNDGSGAEFPHHGLDLFVTSYSAGITSGLSGTVYCRHAGDCNTKNFYTRGRSGFIDGSAEGWVGDRQQSIEDAEAIGTVTTGGTGVTSLAATMSYPYSVMVGFPLIDVTQGVGLNVTSVTPISGTSYSTLAVTGQTYTQSVCAKLTTTVPGTGVQYDQKGPPQPFTVTGISGPLTVPLTAGMAFIAESTAENFVISSPGAISGGNQTLQGAFGHNHSPNGIICQGGPAGQALDYTRFDGINNNAGPPVPNQRYPMWITGASSSSTLIASAIRAGNVISDYLVTGAATSYPAAVVTNSGDASTSPATSHFSIDINSVNWAAGDTIQAAGTPAALYEGASTVIAGANPLSQQIGHQYIMTAPGALFSNDTIQLTSAFNPALLASRGGTQYAPSGINLISPGLGSPFAAFIRADYLPEGDSLCPAALFCVRGAFAPGTTTTTKAYTWFINGSGVSFNPNTTTVTHENISLTEFQQSVKVDGQLTAGNMIGFQFLPQGNAAGTIGNAATIWNVGYFNNLFTGSLQAQYPGNGGIGTSAAHFASGYIDVMTMQSATVAGLTPGNCVQAGTGGLLTTAAAPCGSGSGGTPAVQVVLPTSSIAANTCTTPGSPITITGLVAPSGTTAGTALKRSFEGNPSAANGWGANGGLTFNAWVSGTNQFNWNVCNVTSVAITPGAINVDVGP